MALKSHTLHALLHFGKIHLFYEDLKGLLDNLMIKLHHADQGTHLTSQEKCFEEVMKQHAKL